MGGVTPERYLADYLSACEARLGWLRGRSASSGGPFGDELDLGRDSLHSLWSWAIGRFRLRDPGTPVDVTAVPIWYGRPPAPAPKWWSDDTLELIDGLAYYFGEALVRAVPGARWDLGHADFPNWVNENQPVVTGYPDPPNPILILTTLAGRIYVISDPSYDNIYGVPAATPGDLQLAFDNLVRAAGGA